MSYPTFESATSIEVSSIIMNEGMVLIGRSEGGQWETPTTVINEFEGMKDAAMRVVFENTGVTADPQNVMFVSEFIKKESRIHRIILYLFSYYASGDTKPGGEWNEVAWVDVRNLANYQNDMSDAAVDAFYKFSLVLRQSQAKSGAQA